MSSAPCVTGRAISSTISSAGATYPTLPTSRQTVQKPGRLAIKCASQSIAPSAIAFVSSMRSRLRDLSPHVVANRTFVFHCHARSPAPEMAPIAADEQPPLRQTCCTMTPYCREIRLSSSIHPFSYMRTVFTCLELYYRNYGIELSPPSFGGHHPASSISSTRATRCSTRWCARACARPAAAIRSRSTSCSR